MFHTFVDLEMKSFDGNGEISIQNSSIIGEHLMQLHVTSPRGCDGGSGATGMWVPERPQKRGRDTTDTQVYWSVLLMVHCLSQKVA